MHIKKYHPDHYIHKPRRKRIPRLPDETEHDFANRRKREKWHAKKENDGKALLILRATQEETK
jgi:hypothetical protein